MGVSHIAVLAVAVAAAGAGLVPRAVVMDPADYIQGYVPQVNHQPTYLVALPYHVQEPLPAASEQHQQHYVQENYDEEMAAAHTHHQPQFDDYEDPRGKRETFDDHPDAYLKPPSEDADTPAWEDGNNWDLGYDASDILSPPMPLSLGVPYDTIKYSSEDAQVPDVSAAASTPQRQLHEAPPLPARPYKKYPRSRPEERPRSRPEERPRPSAYYDEEPRPSSWNGRPQEPDYDDYQPQVRPPRKQQLPKQQLPKPQRPRPVDHFDYEERPIRQGKRQAAPHRPSFDPYEYDDHKPGKQAVVSFVKTDQHGHYKWGVRHSH